MTQQFMPAPASPYLLHGEQLMAVMQGAAEDGPNRSEFEQRLELHERAVEEEISNGESDRLKALVETLTAEVQSPFFGDHAKTWQERVRAQLQRAKERLTAIEQEQHHGSATEREGKAAAVKNASSNRRVVVETINGHTYRREYARSPQGSDLLIKSTEISENAANAAQGGELFIAPTAYFEK